MILADPPADPYMQSPGHRCPSDAIRQQVKLHCFQAFQTHKQTSALGMESQESVCNGMQSDGNQQVSPPSTATEREVTRRRQREGASPVGCQEQWRCRRCGAAQRGPSWARWDAENEPPLSHPSCSSRHPSRPVASPPSLRRRRQRLGIRSGMGIIR